MLFLLYFELPLVISQTISNLGGRRWRPAPSATRPFSCHDALLPYVLWLAACQASTWTHFVPRRHLFSLQRGTTRFQSLPPLPNPTQLSSHRWSRRKPAFVINNFHLDISRALPLIVSGRLGLLSDCFRSAGIRSSWLWFLASGVLCTRSVFSSAVAIKPPSIGFQKPASYSYLTSQLTSGGHSP